MGTFYGLFLKFSMCFPFLLFIEDPTPPHPSPLDISTESEQYHLYTDRISATKANDNLTCVGKFILYFKPLYLQCLKPEFEIIAQSNHLLQD